jgi:hypothetical protein
LRGHNDPVPASKSETRTLPGSYDAVLRSVCGAAGAEGMTVTSADPAAGLIHLSTSVSLTTLGEELRVTLRPGAQGVEVGIYSALKFGLVDWGRNRQNIERLFGRLASGPAGAWHPDPSGRHELRWWDGHRWTDTVSDRGRPGTDEF